MDTHTNITQNGDQYRVAITTGGKTHYLGIFLSLDKAIAARDSFVPVMGLPTNISYSYVRKRFMVYGTRNHRKHYVGCYTTLEAAVAAKLAQDAVVEAPDIWQRSREQIKRLSQHPYAVKRIIR